MDAGSTRHHVGLPRVIQAVRHQVLQALIAALEWSVLTPRVLCAKTRGDIMTWGTPTASAIGPRHKQFTVCNPHSSGPRVANQTTKVPL